MEFLFEPKQQVNSGRDRKKKPHNTRRIADKISIKFKTIFLCER